MTTPYASYAASAWNEASQMRAGWDLSEGNEEFRESVAEASSEFAADAVARMFKAGACD